LDVAFRLAVFGWVALLAVLLPRAGAAQHITLAGGPSGARTLTGPNYLIGPNLGKQFGGNLFDSFRSFGVAAGESATFTGPSTVANIIAGVTGGNPSVINGAIKSDIRGANLYLINPAGVVMGPHGTVNVSGSFYASTADYLKLGRNGRFQVTHPDGSKLSAAPPSAFGFLSAKPAAITVNGARLGQVPGTLGLVGGPVSIRQGARLDTPGGRIDVASVAGRGVVPVNPRNARALTVERFGHVNIAGGSAIDVDNPSTRGRDGSVFVRAGTLTIDASTIDADNYGARRGGAIVLDTAGRIALSDGAEISAAGETGSAGNAGNVTVTAGSLSIAKNGEISVSSSGRGAAGAVSVSVVGSIGIGQGAGIYSNALSSNGRSAGDIFVRAGSLSIATNGEIAAGTFGSGEGGVASVYVAGRLRIDGAGQSVPTGIFAQANAGSSNRAGAATVTAGTLVLVGGGEISADTFGSGAGGSVTVSAGILRILADGDISADSAAGSRGNAGAVAVEAGSITVKDGVISAGLLGPSGNGTPASSGKRAGKITVNVVGALTINGEGQSGFTGIASQANTGSAGSAGDVAVTAGSLVVADGGEISAGTFGTGKGGKVAVNVAGRLTINGEGGRALTAITSQANPGSTGPAGNVNVTAASLSITGGGAIAGDTDGAGKAGIVTVNATGDIVLDSRGSKNQSYISADSNAVANAGIVTVSAANLSLLGGSYVSATANTNPGATGHGGRVAINATGNILIDSAAAVDGNLSEIDADTDASGNAGSVTIAAGRALTIQNGSYVSADTLGPGSAGIVTVNATGDIVLDSRGSENQSYISADSNAVANAGIVTVSAANLSLLGGSYVSATANTNPGATGHGGTVSINATGNILVASAGAVDGNLSEIDAETYGSGNAGSVTIAAGGALTIRNGSYVSADTYGPGSAGIVKVTAGTLRLLADGDISADSEAGSNGDAGTVAVEAGSLFIKDGVISAGLLGRSSNGTPASMGKRAGNVTVDVVGALTINATGSSSLRGIAADANPGTKGAAGTVQVAAGTLSIVGGGEIACSTFAAGAGGGVSVAVAGALTIDGAGASKASLTGITSASNLGSKGKAGNVTLTAGSLTIVRDGEISSGTFGGGRGGNVSVAVAGALTINGEGTSGFTGIDTQANGESTGSAGDVTVAAGALVVVQGGAVSSNTFGTKSAGTVSVSAGTIYLAEGGEIASDSEAGSGGDAGTVSVDAGRLDIAGGLISSGLLGRNGGEPASSGKHAGDVTVAVSGPLSIAGSAPSLSGIAADANSQTTGTAGNVRVTAGALSIVDNGEIASGTFGAGRGGDVSVKVAGLVSIDGTGSDHQFVTGITTQANHGSAGNAGDVFVSAGALSLVDGGGIESAAIGMRNGVPASTGDAGEVTIRVAGALSIDGLVSEIATTTDPGTIGNAGSVTVTAGQISIADGGEVVSTAAGLGAGGSVVVTTRSALVLDGDGVPGTEIAASATGPQSGAAGTVTVTAGSLTIEGGAEIASSTAGAGAGGDVNVSVSSDITLAGSGPEITAQSTDSGDAGAITVSAARLVMNTGAAISTEAETSAANGGNIGLSLSYMLYLTDSEITTSVKGETGNGGNIAIAAPFVILDDSSIVAQAEAGHGGNISIDRYAGTVVESADSEISASSQTGISGEVVVNGITLLNGALVGLSSELRNPAALTRDSCDARADRPQSSLYEAGRGGLPEDPNATLPALYLAGRDLQLAPQDKASRADAGRYLPAPQGLRPHCG
jgi:filamentous hemagglutinin family protein